MHLKQWQEKRFFKLFDALVDYANERLGVLGHPLDRKSGMDAYNKDLSLILEQLWADASLIDGFIAENPPRFHTGDLAIIADWKHALHDLFIVVKHENGYSHFMKDEMVYAVIGLSKDISSMVSGTPCAVRTTLLPFEGYIVYDTQIREFPIEYRPNMVEMFNETYQGIKARGAVYDSAHAFIGNAEYHREEKYQRGLDQKIDEHRKEKRLAHPGAYMPQGMHKGRLAGLSPEERKAIIREAEEELEDDLNFGGGESFDYLLKKLPTGTPQTSLEGALNVTTKDRLVELAKTLELPSPYKLKKAELIQQLQENEDLLESLLSSFVVYAGKTEFALFNDLIAQEGIQTRAFSSLKRDDLLPQSPPFICHYRHGDRLTTVMPKEFIDAYRTLDIEGLLFEREHRIRIADCAHAFIGLYGIISLGEFRRLYQGYYPDDVFSAKELFMKLLDMTALYELPYRIWIDEDGPGPTEAFSDEFFDKETYLIDFALSFGLYETDDEYFDEDDFEYETDDEDFDEDDLDDEDFDEEDFLNEWLQYLIERHREIPRKVLDKEEVEDFFILRYCNALPQMQALQQFLDTYVPDGCDDVSFADIMLARIVNAAQSDADMSEFMDLFAEEGLVLDDLDFANDFLEVFSQALNAIPRWSNNGHSPQELFMKEIGSQPINKY